MFKQAIIAHVDVSLRLLLTALYPSFCLPDKAQNLLLSAYTSGQLFAILYTHVRLARTDAGVHFKPTQDQPRHYAEGGAEFTSGRGRSSRNRPDCGTFFLNVPSRNHILK